MLIRQRARAEFLLSAYLTGRRAPPFLKTGKITKVLLIPKRPYSDVDTFFLFSKNYPYWPLSGDAGKLRGIRAR